MSIAIYITSVVRVSAISSTWTFDHEVQGNGTLAGEDQNVRLLIGGTPGALAESTDTSLSTTHIITYSSVDPDSWDIIGTPSIVTAPSGYYIPNQSGSIILSSSSSSRSSSSSSKSSSSSSSGSSSSSSSISSSSSSSISSSSSSVSSSSSSSKSSSSSSKSSSSSSKSSSSSSRSNSSSSSSKSSSSSSKSSSSSSESSGSSSSSAHLTPRENRIYFKDHLYAYEGYHDNVDYGGTNLPDWYNVTGSAFTLKDHHTQGLGTGMIAYNRDLPSTNHSITVYLKNISDGKLIIRARYDTGANEYGECIYDFANNSVTIADNGGDLVTTDFTFSDKKQYVLTMWAFEEIYTLWINDYDILTAGASTFTGKKFAIRLDNSGLIKLYYVKALELAYGIEHDMPEDPTDLLLTYRKFLQQKESELVHGDWEQFKQMYNRYRWNRDIGNKDHVWNELGYPLPDLSTDFLVDT